MDSGLTKIATTEGISSLYAGFLPILAKQGPYAIGKTTISSLRSTEEVIMRLSTLGQFTVNERCTEFINNRMTAEQRESLSSTGKFGVSLTSGIVAGIAAAILSHVSVHSSSSSQYAIQVSLEDG